MTVRRHRGLLYRAINPVYARDPLSGRGAALYGGRFNRKGTAALSTSSAPETALREANQVGTLQPTTSMAYRADIARIFDTRGGEVLAEWRMTDALLGDPAWRMRMNRGEPVPTQDFAEALRAAGFAGLLVRSFARSARANASNLVLWRWNTGADDRLELVDDEGRLSR